MNSKNCNSCGLETFDVEIKGFTEKKLWMPVDRQWPNQIGCESCYVTIAQALVDFSWLVILRCVSAGE